MGEPLRNHQADDEHEAKYANHFHVGHNAFEVVLDFGQQYSPGEGGEGRHPRMHTRVVTTPVYARELQQLLESALDDYERKFAPIPARGGHE